MLLLARPPGTDEHQKIFDVAVPVSIDVSISGAPPVKEGQQIRDIDLPVAVEVGRAIRGVIIADIIRTNTIHDPIATGGIAFFHRHIVCAGISEAARAGVAWWRARECVAGVTWRPIAARISEGLAVIPCHVIDAVPDPTAGVVAAGARCHRASADCRT